MPTQVQMRGANTATQSARTGAAREGDWDTQLKRWNYHDGVTPGGIPHANYADIQKCTFTYAAASGTNTITATYAPAPAALQAGMVLYFKAAATNTGAVTFNPNSLGAANVRKIVSGSKTALAAGDIVSGIMYSLFYDGTDFIISVIDHNPGLSSVSQGDINTSTGTISVSASVSGGSGFSATSVTGPAGEYGWEMNTKEGAGGIAASNIGILTTGCDGNDSSYAMRYIGIFFGPTDDTQEIDGRQRYPTASPPFDLGDGEAGGFVFVLLNKAGDMVSHYAADVPPWAYNGPTSLKPCRECPQTGKKFRKVERVSFEEYVDGVSRIEEEEITQAVKQADMPLIPHPFGNVKKDQSVVLLDPMDERVRRMIEYQNKSGGYDIPDGLRSGLIGVDQDTVKRKGPPGVPVHKLKFRRTG